MTGILRDGAAELRPLAGQRLAVVGYGNQGRSQALNLRDSGLAVVVGNIADASLDRARADGFEALPIAEACARADAILLLVPDEVMPEVFAGEVAPQLRPGKLLDFASGYGVAFGGVRPPPDVDVVLVAPRMIGPGVRDRFVSGQGFPSFVGVHQDATGTAHDRMRALARAIGSPRRACIEMSLHDEACLDLFTEQAFGPAFGRVMLSAVQTLVDRGYPPEAVLLELYLSGELAYAFQKIAEVGMLEQMDYHSHTSQYGSITRAGRFADLDATLRERMGAVLEEIRSGRFAEEWSRARDGFPELRERVRSARDGLPLATWERKARAALGTAESE
ncbi:MAG TPA: NAD(P)-binding domain-containing protein [Myxococcota bacterium]|nr:NAD(P)-binding domain-containing protein [Myxococcota bacterium]